jgi:sphingomyelin phosphodiesterase acid-like 3
MEMSPIVSTCLLLLALPCDGGQFWHISDLHLDHQYVEGGNMSNWCHPTTTTDTPTINTNIVGPAGNYHCDSPADLVESALLAMKRFSPNPDFIVWTGDSAPHWRDPTPDEEYILNVTKHVFTRLDRLFPNVSIIPALGNHDASPPDQFPQYDPADKDKPEYYQKLWKYGAFGDHIDTEAMEDFQKCGFYSKVVTPTDNSMKLKFLVLNTNIYYHDNLTTGADPCGQMDWLNKTLESADMEKEKVFIVAHVPPGSFERNPGSPNFNSPAAHSTDINKQYVQILTDPRYAAKISAHLYGHLHTDTFRVLLDRATRREAVGVAFMAGSVTPVVWGKEGVVGVNPTIRLMKYNDSDGVIMDYQEYSLNITKAAKEKPVAETCKPKNVVENDGEDEPKSRSEDEPKNRSEDEPKSRRKNTKYLDQAKEHDEENKDRTKRESPDGEKPAASGSAPLIKHPTTTTAPQFTTIIAVPKTSATVLTAEDDLAGNNAVTEAPVVVASDTTDTAATKLENTKPVSNVTKKVEEVRITSDNGTGCAEPDYPAYLSTQWEELYQATTSFSVADLSPPSIFSALQVMVSGGHTSPVFISYYHHNTGGHLVEECNPTCWREQLCTVSNLVMEELHTCLNSSGTEGFYEHKILPSTGTDPPPTTLRRKGFGEGVDDPDQVDHLSHDHDGDGVTDHSPEDHPINVVANDQDHADDFPSVSEDDEEDVSKEKLEDSTSNISSRAVAIFFGVFAVAIVALAGAMGYKKYRDNRYRNQEFLLTDAVFRYDGYSQLDDA